MSLGGRGGNQLGKALGSPVSDGSVSYFTKTGKTGVDICQTPADLIINTTPGKFYIKCLLAHEKEGYMQFSFFFF